ncbi:MAG: hypothetical protein QI199_00640 [Candidatus Korarchaeota archaeon]|nr:hypothetical protein [Candidatus Korarchaeota archaeon]
MFGVDLRGEDLVTFVWNFLNREEVIMGKNDVLERVAGKGLLSSQKVTTFSCDGPTYAVLKCPSCGASDLEEMEAWIHVTCGSVTYEKGVCPKCGPVSGKELVSIGPVYRCRSCGMIVTYPTVETPCGHLTIGSFVMYRLTEEGKDIIGKVRRELERLPDPRIVLADLKVTRVEALLLDGPTGVILGTNDEYQRRRERELSELGLRIRILEI